MLFFTVHIYERTLLYVDNLERTHSSHGKRDGQLDPSIGWDLLAPPFALHVHTMTTSRSGWCFFPSYPILHWLSLDKGRLDVFVSVQTICFRDHADELP